LLLDTDKSEYYDGEEDTTERKGDESNAAVMELAVNLASGETATLRIMEEEKFEEDVIDFCQKYNLDDYKRKKLMKLVKV